MLVVMYVGCLYERRKVFSNFERWNGGVDRTIENCGKNMWEEDEDVLAVDVERGKGQAGTVGQAKH